MLMSMFFVINSHFTKIALLGLTHFFGTVSDSDTDDDYDEDEDEDDDDNSYWDGY